MVMANPKHTAYSIQHTACSHLLVRLMPNAVLAWACVLWQARRWTL